jgi:hypothetical protein
MDTEKKVLHEQILLRGIVQTRVTTIRRISTMFIIIMRRIIKATITISSQTNGSDGSQEQFR